MGASSLLWVVLARTATSAKWPMEGAALTPPAVAFPSGFERRHVFLDPGHGAPDNTGNRSSRCEDEQDFTLALATDLALVRALGGGYRDSSDPQTAKASASTF